MLLRWDRRDVGASIGAIHTMSGVKEIIHLSCITGTRQAHRIHTQLVFQHSLSNVFYRKQRPPYIIHSFIHYTLSDL